MLPKFYHPDQWFGCFGMHPRVGSPPAPISKMDPSRSFEAGKNWRPDFLGSISSPPEFGSVTPPLSELLLRRASTSSPSVHTTGYIYFAIEPGVRLQSRLLLLYIGFWVNSVMPFVLTFSYGGIVCSCSWACSRVRPGDAGSPSSTRVTGPSLRYVPSSFVY